MMMMMMMVVVVVQVALDSSVTQDSSELRLSSVERDYFERCVAVMSAAQKLADAATMLTRAVQPYDSGTSVTSSQFCLFCVSAFNRSLVK